MKLLAYLLKLEASSLNFREFDVLSKKSLFLKTSCFVIEPTISVFFF